MRKVAKCHISIGRGTTSVPYIISAEPTDVVMIGNYCSIARGVILITHPGHLPPKGFEDYRVSTYAVTNILNHGFLNRYHLKEPRNYVIVGNDVTIGANAILLPGTKIGNGAVIGAGSVVTTNVPAYAIVAGVPARIIRYRFTQKQIEVLQKIAWWNWDERKIYDNMDYFYGKVADFIEKFSEK